MLLDINSFFYSWIRGGVFLLLVYHFLFYLKHKEDVYKYYSIYLLSVLIFLLNDFFESKTMILIYEYLVFSIQFFSFSVYIHFTRSLIKTNKYYLDWDKAARQIANVLLIMAFVLLLVQFFYGLDFQKKILTYSGPLLSIIFLIRLSYVKIIVTKEGIYSLIGSIILLIGVNITALKIINGNEFLFDFEVHNMFYYFIGILIQIIIYALLLADVLKKIEIEKSNIELNLMRKSSQLNELKMTAFKNQMNPHFLFNSLNSINNYVIKNNKEAASNYVTKFSSLIRKVLQTTEKKFISLEEELKIVELYINMELARVNHSFNYEIKVNEKLNKKEIKVIPLFLQPFIENAIWHGLNSSTDNKKLQINILDNYKNIIAEVIDNGIGLSKSIEKNKNRKIQRKSFGIKTVKNRLELLYGVENISISIKENNNRGTKVTIVFPKNIN